MRNNYAKIIEEFSKLRVLVIGDVMLDSYVNGRVDRISPEAPVPVVNITSRKNKLGGAANVALNLRMLGAMPFLCGVIGEGDISATGFKKLMKENDLSTKGLVCSNERITTVKSRIIGNNTQLLRVDEEQTELLNDEDREKLMYYISHIIEKERIDVIIFEDYDKGVISSELIEYVFTLASKNNIPVTVDPKRNNFFSYSNATLFKPNLKELKEGLGITFDHKNPQELDEAVKMLLEHLSLSYAMVTLSEDGIIIGYNENGKYKSFRAATEVLSVADVSGAGDTVISVASLCIALKMSPDKIIKMANVAAGIVCEQVGVVPVDKNKLTDRLNKIK